MPVPVAIAHTHVHSMRIASGEEALVARVLTAEGVAGFGFTLNFEAVVAREMAAWDALARTRGLPFHALFGRKARELVEITNEERNVIDPFEGASLEDLRARAARFDPVALLAPHAHAWEIGYCAALAATLDGDVRIAVRGAPMVRFVSIRDAPGIGIDWAAEPAFGSLRWVCG
jgi:L-alanine-DL-glutamate epimerase-like enolase superfamily enzyme